MKKHILLSIAILLAGTGLHAQHFKGGFFLDGYHYSYRLNPAVVPETDIRTGILNTVSAETRSNIGIGSFLFPVGDHLTTGLNRHVPAERFLSGLEPKNVMIGSIDVGLFARGFRRNGIYHTIDINIRSSNYACIPRDLFAFLKLGTTGTATYDLSTFHVSSRNYLELSYGMAREAGNFRYGFRIKPLIGISTLGIRFSRFQIDMTDPQHWSIVSRAEFELGGNQFSCPTDGEGMDKRLIPGGLGFKLFRPGFAGVGIAADLGIHWQASRYLELGFSVLDAGVLKWFDKLYASTPELTFRYDPETTMNDAPSDRDTSEKLWDIATFYVRDSRKPAYRIPMTVSATARMKMPFYDKLSVAAVGLFQNSPEYTRIDGRFFTVWSPWNWLSANVSIGRDNFGWEGGMAVHFTTREFNFFVGTDSYIFRVTPQMIPAGRANVSLTFGVSHAL